MESPYDAKICPRSRLCCRCCVSRKTHSFFSGKTTENCRPNWPARIYLWNNVSGTFSKANSHFVRLLGLLWLWCRFQHWCKVWFQTAAVDNLCAGSLWVVQPNNRHDLDCVKEFDRSGQEWEGVFQEVDGAENDPVCHPLGGVSVDALSSVKGLEGHVSRVNESNQVRCELHTSSGQNQRDENGDSSGEEVDLGVSGLFFEFLEFLCSYKQKCPKWIEELNSE